MVENSDENALFRDIQSTKAFISQSELIQKSIQDQVTIKGGASGIAASSSKRSLGGADQAQPEDDLPRFGAASSAVEDGRAGKFKDPFQAEHDELDNLVDDALKNDQSQGGADSQGRPGK